MTLRVYNVDVSADTTVVNAAETVVATLTNVSLQSANQSVRLHGQINILTGTSTTSVVLRVRRDSVSGTVIGEAETDTLAAAVGGTEDHDIEVTDAPGVELAGATYVLTVVQTAGAANGTVNHASLEATVQP